MVDSPGEEEVDEPEEDQDDPSIITVSEGVLYRVMVYLLFEVEDEGEEDEEEEEDDREDGGSNFGRDLFS